MHSQAIRVLSRSASLFARGITATRIPSSVTCVRSYRSRAFHKAEDRTETPEITKILDDTLEEPAVEKTASGRMVCLICYIVVAPTEVESVEDDSPTLSLDDEELKEVEEETNHLFHADEEEVDPCMQTENITERNFEDEFFKMADAMNKKYVEDNVDDTLREEPPEQAQPVTMVEGDDMEAFFKKVLSLNDNEITTEEEDKRMSPVHEEKKEEKKEVKRNTWFNFMPAKELPEGPFGTYSPDQIFNSLEYDLLSRNAREVYKYEKDDMLLTEVGMKWSGDV